MYCLSCVILQHFGCDLVEGSGRRFDACGVCDGDSTSCEIQMSVSHTRASNGNQRFISFVVLYSNAVDDADFGQGRGTWWRAGVGGA